MTEPATGVTLFENGVVHTLDERWPRATWMTVVGDRIQRTGDGPAPAADRRVDLGGRTVLPGFIDAHTHFFQTGLDLLFIDLTGCHTAGDVIERLRAGAPASGWVFAHSYDEEKLAAADRITRRHLDDALGDRPVWINRVDYHSAVASSAALSALSIPAATRGYLAGGGDGGILRAEAYFAAKKQIAARYPPGTRERAVRAAADACLRRGLTAVHALEGGRVLGGEGVDALVEQMDALPVDVTLFVQDQRAIDGDRLAFAHVGGCILIDGSIGSYTAALDQDYADMPGHRGVLYEDPDELCDFVDRAHRLGAQLAFHAIGSRAIGLVLDAYERALDRTPRHDHRHRIEHFELATDAQIDRARDLGVIVSMQPSFEHLWGGPDGMYATRLGDGWRRTNRLRTILDAGVRIAGGSDANVTPADPLLGIHAAVHHRNPDQRITVGEAVRMMTIDAAYAAFRERDQGSLSPGKHASFVVLDGDPFHCAPERIKDLGVHETWCRGRRAFAAAAPATER